MNAGKDISGKNPHRTEEGKVSRNKWAAKVRKHCTIEEAHINRLQNLYWFRDAKGTLRTVVSGMDMSLLASSMRQYNNMGAGGIIEWLPLASHLQGLCDAAANGDAKKGKSYFKDSELNAFLFPDVTTPTSRFVTLVQPQRLFAANPEGQKAMILDDPSFEKRAKDAARHSKFDGLPGNYPLLGLAAAMNARWSVQDIGKHDRIHPPFVHMSLPVDAARGFFLYCKEVFRDEELGKFKDVWKSRGGDKLAGYISFYFQPKEISALFGSRGEEKLLTLSKEQGRGKG